MKTGFIGIIGRPNVGKSTFLNALLGEKIAITSSKPQTTLNRITGIYTDLDYDDGDGLQMIFLDTPGIHKPHNKLGTAINETAVNTFKGVDVILLMIDGTRKFSNPDKNIVNMLKDVDTPKILAVNKMDEMSPEDYLQLYNTYEAMNLFDDIYGVSSKKGTNVDEIKTRLSEYMPEGPMYYPEDIATESTERFIVSEIIREKLLNYLNDEIPHGIYVEIESYVEGDKLTEIGAVIYCEKKSHKAIIIGKKGSKLKGVGKAAREEIEMLIGQIGRAHV